MCVDVHSLPGNPAEYLSERDLQRCFVKSRMRVIDPIHGKRRLRFRNHTFEDFMEVCLLSDQTNAVIDSRSHLRTEKIWFDLSRSRRLLFASA